MRKQSFKRTILGWVKLLRWNKPSGRLILLIPAAWSLWLSPSSPPSIQLITTIFTGGLFVSGAGCIANDLWDKEFDAHVKRTQNRPLVKGTVKTSTAWFLLLIMLILSLLAVFSLPLASRDLCLKLALIAIFPIILYPTAKRWFIYPQALLAFCWGFSVLIPWAAIESTLKGGLPLIFCWLSTCLWTFGFDTIYAMSDRQDDEKIGLNSSAIALKGNEINVVSISYALASICFAIASLSAGVNWTFWLIWIISSLAMQKEVWILDHANTSTEKYAKHFQNQVLIGVFLFSGLIIGRVY